MRDRYTICVDNDDYTVYINESRLKRLKRKVIKRAKIFGLVAIIATVGSKIYHSDEMAQFMPDGYSEIYVDELVDYGETLDDIVSKYYTGEVVNKYPNYNDYKKAISEKNELSYDKVQAYDTLKVPVIVEKNNSYVQKIEELEQELTTFDKWIAYTVKPGDTIYDLAWKGAGTPDEASYITNEIIEYNGIDPNNLQIGQTIYIVNPKIGELKRLISEKKEEFISTITAIESNVKTR